MRPGDAAARRPASRGASANRATDTPFGITTGSSPGTARSTNAAAARETAIVAVKRRATGRNAGPATS